MFEVTARDVFDLQQAIQSVGQSVTYYEDGGDPAGRVITARVRYFSTAELANAIDAYTLELSLDARDFTARPPQKGDSVMVDDARRGVMQVRERRGSGQLISYSCAVLG